MVVIEFPFISIDSYTSGGGGGSVRSVLNGAGRGNGKRWSKPISTTFDYFLS